ncbi:MAG: amino acid adenylation domain-containing protein [Candidatus Eremiobacteraeota bacterium]|nr:amino acid adenylation domain-containing protein [Candidatus Eremiobacteraeota bacterium]
MHRYSGESDIVVAAWESAGYAPLRLKVDGALTFRMLLRALRDAVRAMPDQTNVPPQAAGARLLAHAGFAAARCGELPDVRSLATDVALAFAEQKETFLEFLLAYRPDMFEFSTIQRVAGHFEMVLTAAVRAPDLRIGSLPFLTAKERDNIEDWNATEAPCRRDCSLVELLREQAIRSPNVIAVEFEGAVLTYAELDERANRLGSYLRARGVVPEALVAIALERSLDMIVAVLGVQRAGGAYVPLDPGYPADRIAFMLSDSAAVAVVTQEAVRSRLPAHLPLVVSLDAERDAIARASPLPPPLEPNGERLAYVIYTSGSTGEPKGVQIEHRNVVNFLTGMRAAVNIGTGHTLIALAPLSFDISGLDIYFTLTSGARVVVASRETTVNPKALLALIGRSDATHMQATPSTWQMLVDAGWPGRSGLTILCGGEALPEPLADQLLERAQAVWNLYGPTEATIWATLQRLVRDRPVTIGRPMTNVTAYILDAALQRLPVGVRGELFIGGEGLARGYLHRPELTAERFLPDPFGRNANARMYRTGDLARFRADGTIEFLGRADFQVKLRGYRIEPGEIEAALQARPEIHSAVVVVREDVPGEQILVAYVTVVPGASVASGALRHELGARLPSYMIPDAVVALGALPLNTNGKIDRSRLPPPPRTASTDALRSDGVPPQTPLEAQLAGIWQDVLKVRPIGVTDDFFELGVSSITAARLFDRIERELGAKLPLSPLFAAPTVRKLAALLESGDHARPATSLVPIQPLGSKTPIFCVHGGAGTILHFQPLAKRLGDIQPFYGLQMKGLYGDAGPNRSVKAMARHYLREMRRVQNAGPYVLAGYCFGGMVAVEMARQLQRRGEQVALLVMFNGASPRYVRRYGPVWKPKPPTEAIPFARRVRAALNELRPHRLRHRLRARTRLRAMRDRLRALLDLPVPAGRREAAFLGICRVAARRYRPGPISAPMLLFNGEGLYCEADLGWSPHARGGLEIIGVAGEHRNERDTMHEPQIAFVADRLSLALASLRCNAADSDLPAGQYQKAPG